MKGRVKNSVNNIVFVGAKINTFLEFLINFWINLLTP